MEQTITIYCKNTHTYHKVPRGISLIELKDLLGIQLQYPIIAAHVNYKVENLDFLLYKPKDIEFLDASSPSGMRAYVRTLNMVFACAVNELFPLIISENRPIIEEERQTKEVIKMFAERYNNASSIFEALGNPYCRYFSMGDFIDYYTNVLLPSSGYINVFDLEPFKDGLLLRIPNRNKPTILEDAIPQDFPGI